jgi:hypothetical protein
MLASWPFSPRSARRKNLRATEYCHFLGEQRSPFRRSLAELSLPPAFAVLRGPQSFSVCSVVKKASSVVKKVEVKAPVQ